MNLKIAAHICSAPTMIVRKSFSPYTYHALKKLIFYHFFEHYLHTICVLCLQAKHNYTHKRRSRTFHVLQSSRDWFTYQPIRAAWALQRPSDWSAVQPTRKGISCFLHLQPSGPAAEDWWENYTERPSTNRNLKSWSVCSHLPDLYN